MPLSLHPLLLPSGILLLLASVVLFDSSKGTQPSEAALHQRTPRLSHCFAPGTDPAIIAKYAHPLDTASATPQALLGSEIQQAFQIADRWFRTATNGTTQNRQGDPVTLTWSIVPDTTFIPDGGVDGEVASNSDLRARLFEIYGGSTTEAAEDQPWFRLFEMVFDGIAEQTGVNFVYEPADDGATLGSANRGILSRRGDIRISGHPLDGNGSTLAYNFFPDIGDMVIDTNDSFFDLTFGDSIRLRNTVAHEVGHGLGLAHVCPSDSSKLMEPFINTNFNNIQFDDLYSLQRNYGDIFEKQNVALDNDSFANASPIPIESNVAWSFEWASIDDNTDSDHYSFFLREGGSLTATITPSPNSYLEGPQTGEFCTAGTFFNSATRQNLTLALLGPDGETLITENSTAAGLAETISNFPLTTTGIHSLRVTGSGANTAQLYSIDILADIPEATLQVVSTTQTAELFSDQNGIADPLETVELMIEVSNAGPLDALDTQVMLTGPNGFIPIENTAEIGSLLNGSAVSFPMTFALDASCGDIVTLSLVFTTSNTNPITLPLEVPLGSLAELVSESFDDSDQLPLDWTSSAVDAGSGWEANNTNSSPPRSFFAENVGSTGESILTTPVIGPLSSNAELTFRHSYNTEINFDGGVLEISIDGGDWVDIVTAGGIFTTGAYNGVLSLNSTNPLIIRDPPSTRPAWHGNSNGFITTNLILPPASSGETVQLRWRLGHDARFGATGWFVDDVVLESLRCDTSGPDVVLTATDTTTSEFTTSDTATVTLSTSLPVGAPTLITLVPSGSGSLEDIAGLDNLIIPASSDFAEVTLSAISDSLAEGPEELTLTTQDGTQSVSLSITDTPFGNWAFENLVTTSEGDPDGDLSRNIEEYLFNTDPNVANSRPNLDHSFVDGTLRLSSPPSVPADLLIGAESSPNLEDWNPTFITTDGEEFILTPPSSPYFLRLTYDLLQTDS